MLDAVIIESKSEADLKKLKRVWKSLFITISKNLNINVDDKNDNWSLVEEKILSSNNNTRRSRSSRPTNPHSKSSESSSQLNESELITNKEKEEVLDTYKQLDESKLWKLSTGKIVEKEMMKLVKEAIYEHPSHSFIFDPEDDNWNEYFSEEELTEIRTHKCKKVPELPKELVEFFDSINQGDIDDLYKSISDVYYHPVRDYVCHWAKKCFLEGIELFMSEFFKGDDFTERDLLSRVWRLILLAFDKGELKIREKKYSKATNTQINRKRKLSSIESIERKVTSKRPDQLITFGDYELGIVEGSKIDDDHSTKLFLDSMKKSPKSMKDMLLQLLKVAPHKKHDIKTIALITSGK
ncbi:hypothetical protein BDF21DRAFT_333348 [Thamnidium elegans]|nr:hypothetical protein BDF21DRAFT_333348 [Thamnidium elegans]